MFWSCHVKPLHFAMNHLAILLEIILFHFPDKFGFFKILFQANCVSQTYNEKRPYNVLVDYNLNFTKI